MAEYTFYKPDGTITAGYTVSPEELALISRPGENYIEGAYSYYEYSIIDGVPVKHGKSMDQLLREGHAE